MLPSTDLGPDLASDLHAVDVGAATVLAAASGQRVRVSDQSSPSRSTFVLPDGSVAQNLYAGPELVADGAGGWNVIDTTLVPRAGRLTGAAVAGSASFSTGGSGDAVQLTSPAGTFGLRWPASLPAPVAVGDTATYLGAAASADLLLRQLRDGFELSIREDLRPLSAPSYTLPLDLPQGWTVRADGPNFDVVDSTGATAGTLGAASMSDSSIAPQSEEARHGTVSESVTQADDGSWQLLLKPDQAFLSDPSTVFPVTVDPSVTDAFDTYASSAYPTETSGHSDTQLKVGYYSSPTPASVERSYIQFDTSGIENASLHAATLNLYELHQWNCAAEPMHIYRTTDTINNSTDWTNKPTHYDGGVTASYASGDTCSGGQAWTTADVLTPVQLIAHSALARSTLMLAAVNESDANQYKKFASDETSQNPYISVTLNTAPGPPAKVVAAISSGVLTTNWDPPTNNGGTGVTGYNVALRDESQTGYPVVQSRSNVTAGNQMFSGLTAGDTYYTSVAAINAAGTGASTASNTVVDVGYPGAPQNLTAVGHASSVTATWSPPPSNGGSAVTGYQVTLSTGGTTISTTTTTSTTATVPATNGTAYTVAVAAKNGCGCAASGQPTGYGQNATITVTAAGYPTAPQSLTVTPGDSAATASWSTPATMNGSPIGHYKLLLDPADATPDGSLGSYLGGAGLTAALTGGTGLTLTDGTTYELSVTAQNGSGDAYTTADGTSYGPGFGPPVTSTDFQPAPVPAAPGSPTATADQTGSGGQTSVTVSWAASSAPSYSPVDSYTVQALDHQNADAVVGAPVTVTGNATSADVGGLAQNHQYDFTVTASNAGNSTAVLLVGGGTSTKATTPTATTSSAPTIVKTLVNPPANNVYADGQPISYQLQVTNPTNQPITVSSLTDQLPAGADLTGLKILRDAVSCTDGGSCATSPTGLISVAPFTLSGQQSSTITYTVIAATSTNGCQTLNNTASAADSIGSTTSLPVSALVCDTDLGLEPWWTYDSTAVADGSTAQVNAANGNLVVAQNDAVPVQDHGHLALNIRRSYNSEDTGLVSLPGSIGGGWTLNVGQTDALAGYGVDASGLSIPSTGSLVNQLTDPLAVTLIDRDGTRHVFEPNSVGAALDVSALTGPLAALKPLALLNPTGGAGVCLDQTFTPPAGVHEGLWRYVFVGTSGSGACSAANVASGALAGYVSIRPDRLREEYDATGRLLATTDQAGVTLRYTYYSPTAPTPAKLALAAVYEATQTTAGGGQCTPTVDNANATATTVPGCRGIALNYPSASSETVTDPSGQVTSYRFHPASYNPAVKLLDTVTNPGSHGTVGYIYQGDGSTSCGGSVGQLCAVVDERGHTTRFGYDYTSGQLASGRVTSVTNRRGYSHTLTYLTGDPAFGTALKVDGPGAGINSTGGYTDPSTASREIVYGQIDSYGRVGVTVAGPTGLTYDPSTHATNALNETRYLWDGPSPSNPGGTLCRAVNPVRDNDLCQLTVAGSGTTPDAVTTSSYDDAGMILSQAVSAARGDGGATAASTLTTTYGYDRQYALAGGSTTTTTETVAGGGQVTVPAAGSVPTSGVLYTLADQTQQLSACGNAAGTAGACGSEDYTADLTSYAVDDNPNDPPNTSGGYTCAAGAGGTNANGNTGLVCTKTVRYAQDRRTSGNTASTAITASTYGADGEKTSMTTPNGGVYRYAYYPDGQGDASGTVNAGGWLLGTTDPLSGIGTSGDPTTATSHFVAFNEDPYGHTVRSWDRNATSAAGKPLASFAQAGTAQLSAPHTTTLYDTGTAPTATPWRWSLSATDPTGATSSYTLDATGNRLTVTSPIGATTGPSGNQPATPATYDADNEQLSATSFTGDETQHSYNAFDEPATVVSPNATAAGATPVSGITAANTYDTVGRVTTVATVRGPTTPNCPATGGMFPAGQSVCTTTTGYDTEDNPVQTTDGNGQLTATGYDADHRVLTVTGPAYDSAGDQPVTATVYDADGDTTTTCTPRQHADNAASGCTDTATGYLTHTHYDVADRAIATDTYRAPGGAVQTTSTGYDADGNPTVGTDADAHTTTRGYDLDDRPTSTTTPRSSAVSYTVTRIYDPVGDTTALVTPGNAGDNTGAGGQGTNVRITGYTFDADHRTLDTVTGLQVTAANPAALTYNDPALTGALTGGTATGTSNTRTRTVYDPDGNQIASYHPRAFAGTIPAGAFTSAFQQRTVYDADDQPTAVFTPRSDAATTDPNASALSGNEAQQCQATAPAGAPAYPSGTRLCETDAGYDHDGKVTSQTLPTQTASTATARKETASYTADDLPTLLCAPNPAGTAAAGGCPAGFAGQAVGYDADGQPLTATDQLGLVTTSSYYPNETVAQVQTPGTGAGHTHLTSYTYDANGQQTSRATPRTTYNTTTGAVTGTETDTTTATYTADGLLAQQATPGATTADQDITAYTYDAVGNATRVTSPSAYYNNHLPQGGTKDGDNTAAADTTNDYTADNLLLSTAQPVASDGTRLRRTSNTLDPAGETLTQATDVTTANNPTTPTDNTSSTVVTAGGTLGFGWAPDGRQTSRTGRGSADTVSTGYDPDGDPLTVTDAASGTTATTLTASYYDDDRLRATSEPVKRNGKTLTAASSFSYDGNGATTARTSASTSQYYTDNDAGLPVSAAGAAAYAWTYNTGGQPTSQTNPNNSSQSWTWNTTSGGPADDTLAATSLTTSTGTVLSSDTYSYDENHQQTADTYYGTAGGSGTTVSSSSPLTYRDSYDAAGRLAGWTHPTTSDADPNNPTTYAVGYDHDSNRLRYGARTATYQADDSVVSDSGDTTNGIPATSYTYDADGRMTADGVLTYAYDAFDRLACQQPKAETGSCGSKTSTSYTYDGLDRQASRLDITSDTQISAHTTTGLMAYEGTGTTLAVEQTYNDPTVGGANWTDAYQLTPTGQPLAYTHNAALDVLSGDAHGNVGLETGPATGSATPGVACTTRYDPYGSTLSINAQTALTSSCSTGTTTNTVLYQAQRRDATTSSYQLGARTYNPAHGTYNTPDTPAAPGDNTTPAAGTDPLTKNTYSYVNGDPLNLSDPSGHKIDACGSGPDANGEDCRGDEGSIVYEKYIQPARAAAAAEDASTTRFNSCLDNQTPHGSLNGYGESCAGQARNAGEGAALQVYDPCIKEPGLCEKRGGLSGLASLTASLGATLAVGIPCETLLAETVVGAVGCAGAAGAAGGAVSGAIDGCSTAACYAKSATIGAATGVLSAGILAGAGALGRAFLSDDLGALSENSSNALLAGKTSPTGPALTNGADAGLPRAAEDGAAAARGLSSHGGVFSSEANEAGGTVSTSTGLISQNDVAPLVNSGMYGGDVNVLSGVHGLSNGSTLVDSSLYEADVARFGNLPGVSVFNLSDLSAAEITGLLRGQGTTIGAFCDSGACLARYR